jgi:O-antigen/teichoic acid export membrane protein
MLKAISSSNVAEGPAPPMDHPAHHVQGDLGRRTVRSAFVAGAAQGTAFILRTGSMVIMARLLFPADFGLVGMVTAVTGFMAFFHDLGLSTASIQRVSVTREQISTLFWVNLLVGAILATVCAIMAPVLVRFYGDQRLLSITMLLGTGFLFNSAAVQHRAMLTRDMRFGALAIIDTSALVIGIASGIGLALAGRGYWALVIMAIAPPFAGAIGTWLATGWIPGRPRRHVGIKSMLVFGGTVTLNNLIVYLAYNTDKMLLGRFWGADVLGVYGRAYQLINIPTENLNSTIAQVALPALARIQNDPNRVRSYFLQGYGLFFALVLPITVGCALFAEDIVQVFLGQRWHDAPQIFRLLAPTMLVFALINPFGWLLIAIGRTARSLRMAFVIAPVVMLGYSIGVQWGAAGVAVGFSSALLLLAVPLIGWARHDTLISLSDIGKQIGPPLASAAVSSGVAIAAHSYLRSVNPVFVRLCFETAVLFGTYVLFLFFAMGQKPLYLAVLRNLSPSREARAT